MYLPRDPPNASGELRFIDCTHKLKQRACHPGDEAVQTITSTPRWEADSQLTGMRVFHHVAGGEASVPPSGLRLERLSVAQVGRRARRRTESKEVLEKLKTWLWIQAVLKTLSIGKAAAYAIANWDRLTRFADNALTRSTTMAQRAIRGPS